MTEENKRENIREELERAEAAERAAHVLLAAGLLNDAVSRLYYSVLHRVRALLLSEGLEPRSHNGALQLFSLKFVKVGHFDPKSAHLFSKLTKYREDADYSSSYQFGREDVELLLAEAAGLSRRIASYLTTAGYLR